MKTTGERRASRSEFQIDVTAAHSVRRLVRQRRPRSAIPIKWARLPPVERSKQIIIARFQPQAKCSDSRGTGSSGRIAPLFAPVADSLSRRSREFALVYLAAGNSRRRGAPRAAV